MITSPKLRLIFILALAGTAFATVVSLRQWLAPTTEPGILSCVGLSILGLSPCPYGLGLFLLLTIISGLMIYQHKNWLKFLRLTAVAGVIFSGWVVWRELCLPAIQAGPVFWENFSLLNIPACAWGFLVFVSILILAYQLKPTHQSNQSNL